MKLAIITTRFPYPIEKGDKLRIYYQIKELSKRHDIYLFALTHNAITQEDLNHLKQFCKAIKIYELNTMQQWGRLALAFIGQKALQLAFFASKKQKQKLQKDIAAIAPDVVYVQLIRAAYYAQGLPYPKVIDFMDAFSLGVARRADASPAWKSWIYKREARYLSKYESLIYEDFEGHSIISVQDKNHLSFDDNNNRIKIIPNGVDISFFKPMPTAVKKYDLAFIGNMGYYPNVKAAIFLCKKVLPLVRPHFPNIKILIAGARPSLSILALANNQVKISGWLEDIREAYASSKIFVAPIFQGSGQQNKILEAMAMACPTITTSLVNNAINAKENKDILCAETAEDFALAIMDLLKNPEKRDYISQNALTFVHQKYSWEKSTSTLERLLISVSQK